MLRSIAALAIIAPALIGLGGAPSAQAKPALPPNVQIVYGPMYPSMHVGSTTTISQGGDCATSDSDGKLVNVVIKGKHYLKLSLPKGKHERFETGIYTYNDATQESSFSVYDWNGKRLPIHQTYTASSGKTYHMKLTYAEAMLHERHLVLEHGGPCTNK